MTIDSLKASTGFRLTPLQVGSSDDAFLEFVDFMLGKSAEAKLTCDHFVRVSGLINTHNAGDIPAVSGEFIDWLILNYWGVEPSLDKSGA